MSAIRHETEMLSSPDLYHFDLAMICCQLKWSRAVFAFGFNVRATVKKDLDRRTDTHHKKTNYVNKPSRFQLFLSRMLGEVV